MSTRVFFVDDDVNLFLKAQCEEWVVFGELVDFSTQHGHCSCGLNFMT